MIRQARFGCAVVPPASDEGARGERQRASQRAYAASHREEINARARKRRADNPEPDRAATRRYRQRNPEAATESKRRWRAANPDKVQEYERRARERRRLRRQTGELPPRDPAQARRYSLWAYHKMTSAEWDLMWESQAALCYLCERPMTYGDWKRIAVEHDHGCCPRGRSCPACRRGLAHMTCNLAIGYANDDPRLLRTLADNLERRQAGLVAARRQGRGAVNPAP